MSIKRLLKEIESFKKDKNEYFYGSPEKDNIYLWNVVIKGPKKTPYENKLFKLKVKFPKQYPFKPPKIEFVTKIFHPNVSLDGEICVDILKGEWSAALTI